MTESDTLSAPPFQAYMGAKTLAERAVWQFADEHKDVDITVINPPYLFGPFAPGFILPKPDYAALSTNLHVYQFLTPKGKFPTSSGSADVRDIARIHVESLRSAPESVVGRKRLIVSSPFDSNYKDAIHFILHAHPELKDRIVDVNTAPVFPIDKLPVDLTRVAKVTGVQVDSYHTWKETVLDTVDSLLALEAEWKGKGFDVEIPALGDYGL